MKSSMNNDIQEQKIVIALSYRAWKGLTGSLAILSFVGISSEIFEAYLDGRLDEYMPHNRISAETTTRGQAESASTLPIASHSIGDGKTK